MKRLTGTFARALVVTAVGFCVGLGGGVGETFAQSDSMKKDDTMMKKDEKKDEDTMMKNDGETMMKKDEMKDDKMMKDDKAMEKKP